MDFKKFCGSDSSMNQRYDEVYISVFRFDDEDFFVEHNELLNKDDIGKIVGFVAGALCRIKGWIDWIKLLRISAKRRFQCEYCNKQEFSLYLNSKLYKQKVFNSFYSVHKSVRFFKGCITK